MSRTKTQAVSFRLDGDLQPMVKEWLKHNPSLNVSRLTNLAIRYFIMEDQTLQSISTIKASETTMKNSLKRMMKKHKKTLDELK